MPAMPYAAASYLAGGRSCPPGCPRTPRRQHAAVWARSRQQRDTGSSMRSSGPARSRLQLLATSTVSEVAIHAAAEDEFMTLDRTMGSMDLSPTSSMEETGVALPSTVPVQFVVPEYVTKWGQKLKVVGSAQELGNWMPDKAPAMHWHDGHFWTLDVELPVGTVNFKVIMAQENGYVRWEDGDNRAIDIPAVLPDSETPVGHVDVTCNWNDVTHSQTAVRPDRAYLRGKLRAVEAKVMAIQERKKRLDTKMLQLNANLQNFDRVVNELQEDVGEALQDKQWQALGRAAGEAAAAGRSSLVAAVPPTVGPAEALPQQQNGRPAFLDMPPPVVVPILDPKDLEPIDVAGAQAAAAAAASRSSSPSAGVSAEEVQEQLEGLLASQMDHDMLTAAAEAAAVGSSADLGAAAAAEAAQQRITAAAEQVGLDGAADWGPVAGALEQQPLENLLLQRISENVLAVTVSRLIAAAEDALDQDPPAVPGEASVDTTQLAVEYLEELEAAAGALEKETDNRLAQLLAAALRATGGVPEDFETLAAPIMAESLRGALRQGRSRATSRAASRSVSGSTSPVASMGVSPLSSMDQPAPAAVAEATTSYDSLASSWSEEEQEQEAVQEEQQLGQQEEQQAEDAEVATMQQVEALPASSAPEPAASSSVPPAAAAAPAPAAMEAPPVPSRSSSPTAVEQPTSPRSITIVASFTPKPEFAAGRQEAGGVVTFTANDLQAQVDPAELLAQVLQRTLSSHFRDGTVAAVNAQADAASIFGRSGGPKHQQKVVVVGGQPGGDWAQKMQVAAAAKEAASARVAAAQLEADKLRKAAKESLEGFQ